MKDKIWLWTVAHRKQCIFMSIFKGFLLFSNVVPISHSKHKYTTKSKCLLESKVSLAGQILAHLKAHTRATKLHKTLQTALSRAMRRHVCVLSKNGEAGHEYLEQTVSLNTRKVNVGVYV